MFVHEFLDYKDGKLFWKDSGKSAEYVSRHGTYYVRLPNKSTRPAANIVWEGFGNALQGFLEHLDGDKLNNRIENLASKGFKGQITKEFLQARFYYDNGHLRFKNTNKIVGFISKEGYRRFSMAKRIFGLHQMIWIYFHGYLPREIDHIDGDKLNNRIENLRECNRTENRQNTEGWKSKELPKGVYKGKSGGYQVRITYRRICKSYGTYSTLQEAADVADETYSKLHGAFYKRAELNDLC